MSGMGPRPPNNCCPHDVHVRTTLLEVFPMAPCSGVLIRLRIDLREQLRVIAFERPSGNSNRKFRNELPPHLKFGMPGESCGVGHGRRRIREK